MNVDQECLDRVLNIISDCESSYSWASLLLNVETFSWSVSIRPFTRSKLLMTSGMFSWAWWLMLMLKGFHQWSIWCRYLLLRLERFVHVGFHPKYFHILPCWDSLGYVHATISLQSGLVNCWDLFRFMTRKHTQNWCLWSLCPDCSCFDSCRTITTKHTQNGCHWGSAL